jgi:putative SOS response-associated peptidase YedK
MCGRYGASWGVDDLVEEFDVAAVDVPVEERLAPDWNVAPTKPVYAVINRRPRDEPDAEPSRRLVTLQWGLVPFWAKDPKVGARMINARIETAAEKPAFREAFAKRRCLLPADGFYEWYTPEGTKAKQPFFIRRRGGGTLAMAGLYEFWRDPEAPRNEPSAWLRTCTILTTTATDAVGHIHDRMPMVIPPDRWDAWLDPGLTDPQAAQRLLAVTEPDQLEAYAVSTLVSNVKNNGPELLEPLAEEPDPTLF